MSTNKYVGTFGNSTGAVAKAISDVMERNDALERGAAMTGQPAIGESIFDRREVTSSVVLATGTMKLSYWTARKDDTINVVKTTCSAAFSGGTPTLSRLGIYLENADLSLTLLTSIPNDITLWAAAATRYTRNLSAAWNKIGGQRYALGTLCVTAGTGPGLSGIQSQDAAADSDPPRLSGQVAAQADLPATVAAGSITNTGGRPQAIWTP